MKYLPLSFGKILFYLSTNAILDVLVWGGITWNPEHKEDYLSAYH